MCGASSFIQTQRRPVTQQIHAMHVPVIHVPHAQRGCVPAITLLATLGGVGAAIAGIVVSYMATSPSSSVTTPITFSPPATPAGADTSSPAAAAEQSGPRVEQDYFADATRVKARYETVLKKPIMAKELVIYQYYATLEAQSAKNPEHVDSYKLWANKVERPEAVRLGADKRALGQILFSLDSVNFALAPKLIKQALSELKIEEGKVTHLYLERDGSSAQREPIWRVYVNGSRESGFVEFSLAGETRRVAK